MVRLVSGLALAAAALAAILFLPALGLRLLACAVAALAAFEYQRIVSRSQPDGTFPFVILVCWSVSDPEGSVLGLAIVALAIAAAEVLYRNQPIGTVAVRGFAALYIGLPLGLLVATHRLGGREAVLLLLFTIVVSDSAQYYSGRLFGRRPLAPAISPKKTIEGAIGGVAVGTLFTVFAGRAVFPFVRPLPLALLGLTLVVLGIAGDLFESRLKRSAGVKDSSELIPGHGGILDRIDALLFASPAFYVFVHEVM